jgi:hypothetical protein
MPDVYQDILKGLAGLDVEDLNIENQLDTRLCASLSQIRANELAGDVIGALRDLWGKDAGLIAGKDGVEIGLCVVRDRREMIRR